MSLAFVSKRNLIRISAHALLTCILTVLFFSDSARADIGNQCNWQKQCVEESILNEIDDLHSRLVWSSTLGLEIDDIVKEAITKAPETELGTNSAIVRVLFEQGRIRDALDLSISGRKPARLGEGFEYPSLLHGDRVVDLSTYAPAFPALLHAMQNDDFSLNDIETISAREIEILASSLPKPSSDRRKDERRLHNLRNVSKYGFWDAFALYVVPIAPELIASAVWHAEEFGEYQRAVFLASVENHLIKTGGLPSDRDSRLSTPLRRIFKTGLKPICFREEEVREFLEDAKWPDLSSPRDICLDFFKDFPVFEGSDLIAIFIDGLSDGEEREEALDFFRDIALNLPIESKISSILIDKLAQVEGGNAPRTHQLVAHFFDDPVAMRSESIRVSGALKKTSYLVDLNAWREEPHENVDRRLVNRPSYFASYPRRGPHGTSQSDAFAFYDEILSEFPKNEKGKVEFFSVLFSRSVDWVDPKTPRLMKIFSEKYDVDWKLILAEKDTAILLAAIAPGNHAALKFILDEAVLDKDDRYLDLDKLDDGYAYLLLEAMWNAGLCEKFHKNASDPRVVEELVSSKRGYGYFNLRRLYTSRVDGCWRSN